MTIQSTAVSVPNRCKHNKGQGQCKNAMCRNLDGSWSTYCQHHKDYFKNWQKNARQAKKTTVWDVFDEDDSCAQVSKEVGLCELCDQATRPKKNGNGYTKFCDDCQEDSTLIYKTVIKFKRARHALESMSDPSHLRQKKQKLEKELQVIQDSLAEVDNALFQVEDDIAVNKERMEQAQRDLDMLL